MAIETHAHDGTANRKAKEIHAHDGTAWRKAKEVHAHDGTAWRKVFVGFTIVNPLTMGTSYSDSSDGGGGGSSVSLSLSVYGDGTWSIDGSTSGTLGSGNWGTPTTTGVGSNYWVRFSLTATSGTGDSGPNTTSWTLKPSTTGNTGWLQLSSTRSVFVSSTGITSSRNRSTTWTIEIATDSSGTNIVTSDTGVVLSTNAIP